MGKKIHFIGLLSNVDSSILKFKLCDNYEIKSISEEDGVKMIASLEKTSLIDTSAKISLFLKCLNLSEKKIYYVSNFINDVEVNKNGIPDYETVFKKDHDFYGYLRPITSKMRLFKEGNIKMPVHYFFYYDKNSTPNCFLKGGTTLHVFQDTKYHLVNSEITELKKFIENTKLPFKKEYLQLAFKSFEESYDMQNKALSFLLLMIAVEVLFIPDDSNTELAHRICRNIAVLLGENPKQSEKIYEEIKRLYNIRGKIIHAGKFRYVTESDLLKLREYVRASIKKIDSINKDKKDLLKLLNSSGFGANI